MGDDRILLTLKTAWADWTRHLLFEPKLWGRLRPIATLHDPAVIWKILAHRFRGGCRPKSHPAAGSRGVTPVSEVTTRYRRLGVNLDETQQSVHLPLDGGGVPT